MDLDKMDDDELAASAFVWRKRAMHGDAQAAKVAQAMEAELRRRLSDTPSRAMPLEELPSEVPAWRRFLRRLFGR